VNYKRKSRRRFFLLTRSRTSPISSEFWGGFEHPKPPPRYATDQNDSVPSRNTVLLWVRNFRETVSATKRKPPGREPSLRTPENIKRVRQAFVRSPWQSASRNAIAFRMSHCKSKNREVLLNALITMTLTTFS